VPANREAENVTNEFTGTISLDIRGGPGLGAGDGLCVGRDDASPVLPTYTAPVAFTGGTIDKVVVDVSGERYVGHEAEVWGWFILD
jgi:arylsulfatase